MAEIFNSSKNQNVAMSVALKFKQGNTNYTAYKGRIGLDGFHLTEARYHHVPGTVARFSELQLGDEEPLLKALAFTDAAYANVDDLVGIIDTYTETKTFGRNTPGEIENSVLNSLKIVIQSSIKSAKRKDAWKVMLLLATGDVPRDLLYRIREAELRTMDMQYNRSTGKVTVTPSETLLEYVTNGAIAKATLESYLLQEGELKTVGDSKVQVLPENSLTKRLSEDPTVTVTVGGTDVDMNNGSYGAKDLPTGFSMPTKIMDDEFTFNGTLTAENIDSLAADGKAATVSKFTTKQHKPKPLFDLLATQSHAENARALSIAYATLHTLPKSTDKHPAQEASISQVETAANAPYLFSTVLKLQCDSLLDEKTAKSQIKSVKTRSKKTAIGDIWSFNTAKKASPMVPHVQCLINARVDLLALVAQEFPVGSGYDPYCEFEVNGVKTTAVVATAPCCDTDASATSIITAEYAKPQSTNSGYGDIVLSNNGLRLFATADSLVTADQVSQLLWLKNENSYIDIDELVEALRADSESEWAAALRSITPTGLGNDSKCNILPWLVAGGAVAAVAASDKDEDKNAAGVTINTQSVAVTGSKAGDKTIQTI